MNFKYFWFWLPMIALAFLNATLRELFLVKHFNALHAHQLSTVTLTILCTIYVWLIFSRLGIQDTKQALIVGALWVVLTVVFEFSLGLILKHSWASLLEQYDISSGHIWPLLLSALLFLPYLFYSFKR